MKLINLFITLGILAAPALQAADLCSPVELEDPVIKERARIVHFPKERSVTLVGHMHGERSGLKRFSHWAKDPDDELSNDEWLVRVQTFVTKNEKTMMHAKQDLGFLRASLWTARQPIFVAVESQDDDVAGHAQSAIEVSTALWKAHWKRELDNMSLMRDAELITMGGTLYSYLYDTELKDKYELVGMEGTAEGIKLQKEGKKKMSVGKKQLAKIAKQQEVDEPRIQKAMAFVVNEMNKAYDDIANILVYDHQFIRSRLVTAYPNLEPKVRGALLTYLYGYLDVLRGMKKRDVFFSRKLALQDRSSIFFVGEEHLTSLTNLLQIQCYEVKAGNPIHLNATEQPPIEEL